MHSEICPVCQGTGKTKSQIPQPCHGCNGKGWVEVQDSVYPPYVPVSDIPPYDPCPYPPYVPVPDIPPYVPAPFDPGPWVGSPNTCENDNQVTQKDFPQYVYVAIMDSGGSLNRV